MISTLISTRQAGQAGLGGVSTAFISFSFFFCFVFLLFFVFISLGWVDGSSPVLCWRYLLG